MGGRVFLSLGKDDARGATAFFRSSVRFIGTVGSEERVAQHRIMYFQDSCEEAVAMMLLVFWVCLIVGGGGL